MSLQRIPTSIDPFGQAGGQITPALTPFRTAAVAKVYLGMQQIKDNLNLISGALAAPPMPAFVVGSLTQPDGAAGANLQVQFDPATVSVTGPVQTTLTIAMARSRSPCRPAPRCRARAFPSSSTAPTRTRR